jgi:hypothetical protein
MRAAGLAVALGLVTAVPAHAYTWRASPAKAMWASYHGKHAAGAYGTWYVNKSTNRVTFYPNVYAAKPGGAYAQASMSVSSDNRSWAAGPQLKSAKWKQASWHQYPMSVTLPGSLSYVKTLVSVGYSVPLAPDPMHTVSIPVQRY